MDTAIIPDIQQKYAQLSPAQKICLRVMVYVRLNILLRLACPLLKPFSLKAIAGINAEGKMQAYNPDTDQYYLWISDLQWQTTQRASQAVDLKEDALEIWNIFDLKSYELIELSHVHRDFLQV